MDNLSHRWEPDQFDPYLVMIGYIFNYYLVDNFFFFFFAEPVLLQTFQIQQFHHYSHQVKCRTARLAFFSLFFFTGSMQNFLERFWSTHTSHTYIYTIWTYVECKTHVHV